MTADADQRRPPTIWRRAPGWVQRVVDEEVLLVGPGGEFKSIGGMATAVWIVLDAPASGDEIRQLIAHRWPDRPADLSSTIETIEVLHAEALIEPVPGTGGAPD